MLRVSLRVAQKFFGLSKILIIMFLQGIFFLKGGGEFGCKPSFQLSSEPQNHIHLEAESGFDST